MLINKKPLLVVVAIASMAPVLVSFHTRGQQKDISEQERQKREFYSQYPTALYNAPENSSPERRAERSLKSKRYDKGRMPEIISQAPVDDTEEVFTITEDLELTPGLPVNESELVVIGEILDANAYLSNNKKRVYSEFSFRISDVLKKNDISVSKGESLCVDREGGYVQFENGRKRLHSIGGLLMPLVGRRYVLFLKNKEKTPNYEIVSGYELKADGVKNLNGSEKSRAYAGMDEMTFMKLLYKAIAEGVESRNKKED
ncbi:MAG TPA: hypothetical protein PLP21_19460 [Pyrinomonadaceae bacterium]|nr:hypothetical protein [Acidobacteriota bacterium]HQZ98500.1 hypothetical protein [Pyrinomonadaceae bacterium]